MRTLFLGDSHASGYKCIDNKVTQWGDNNYADVYSTEFDRDVTVYAQPGASNQKYPTWVKSMLDYYDDIDELFVQSTYWNRWLMGCSRNLEYGANTKADLFLDTRYVCPRNPRIKYMTDWRAVDDYVELVEQPRAESFEQFKGIIYDENNITSDWAPFHEKYTYSKLYHECLTHLQYREYCGNLYIINSLCKERGIRWYLWRINNRVYFPDHLDFFGKLDCTVADKSAEQWIKETYKINIQDTILDTEHYSRSTHELIGKDYFTYLKNKGLQ